MGRRRTRQVTICDVEEDDGSRRISTRKRAKVKYSEEPVAVDNKDNDTGGNMEQDEQDVEQAGRLTLNSHSQKPLKYGLLLVTCGSKEAFLDIQKMANGEAFIKCEGRWLFPHVFEGYGGKGSCRKWKNTIHHENKPLKFWFEQGTLSTKGLKKERLFVKQAKKKNIPSSDNTTVTSCKERATARKIPEKTKWRRKAKVVVRRINRSMDDHSTVSNPSSIGEDCGEVLTREVKEDEHEATGSSTTPPSAPAASSPALQLQLLNGDPQTNPALPLAETKQESTNATTSDHDTAEGFSASSSTGQALSSDLDVLDLDQLKREKLKMQLKVLKLQEEYYTLKIQREKR